MKMIHIVLCLILDSRQNERRDVLRNKFIVLCLILDSRQNNTDGLVLDHTIVLCLILDSRQNIGVQVILASKLYCALFWIQGKTGVSSP